MKFEKKKTKAEKIAMIKQMAEVQIPAQIKVCQSNIADKAAQMEYESMVVQMTMLIVETVIGATTVVDKDNSSKWYYKFNSKLCSISELNEICNILDGFIDTNMTSFGSDDDMDIPKKAASKMQIDKLNSKCFSKAVVNHMMSFQSIDRATIMELAGYAEQLRRKQNIQKTLIIAGAALLIVGGTVTGVYVYNKCKEDDLADADGIDVSDIPDVDVADIPEIDVEDIPNVELSETME